MALSPVTYTTVDKVSRLLQLSTALSGSTTPNIEQVQNIINQKEDWIDRTLKTSFRLTEVRNEYHDLILQYYPNTGYAIYLKNRRIIPFVSGTDKLEVWNGTTNFDLVANLTEGRNHDWWADYKDGIVYIKSRYPIATEQGIRLTYRYGGTETQVNDGAGLLIGATTVTVDDTSSFPVRGWFRINDEEITYTGKTATTFTGLVRGAFNTTAAAHADDDVILTVPKDIEELCTKLVAIDVIGNSEYQLRLVQADGAQGMNVQGKITEWRNDIEKIIANRKEVIQAVL